MCSLLLELLRTSHLILGIPEIPIAHEQSFIRIAPSSLDTLESPLLFGNTSHSERLLEIYLTTSMLDLRKKTIKGFRSNQTLLGLTLYG